MFIAGLGPILLKLVTFIRSFRFTLLLYKLCANVLECNKKEKKKQKHKKQNKNKTKESEEKRKDRGTQQEYSSKPLRHRIVERILAFKR